MPTVVSLFSGCGGLDLGFKELGFDLLYACDSDEAAVDCYARNIDSRVYLRDVTSEQFHSDIENLGSCDVVLGGFPCQGFSKAGPKNQNDPRNVLFNEMKRSISILQPNYFIAENVDGVSQNFKGNFLKNIIDGFEEIGYNVDYRILDAVNFGLPQHRRRIFFVGVRRDLTDFKPIWPLPTHHAKLRNGEFKIISTIQLNFDYNHIIDGNQPKELKSTKTISDAIGDITKLDKSVPDHDVLKNWPKKYEAIFKVIKQGQKLCNVRHAQSSVYTWQVPEVFGEVNERELLILRTIGKYRRLKKYGSIPNGNPLPLEEIEYLTGLTLVQPDINSLLQKNYLKLVGNSYDLKGAMFVSGIFKRPLWNEPAPTVLTNFYNPRYFLHPIEDRPFSLRECARLQGFPDNFLFTGSETKVDLVSGYRLVGNAVTPLLSRKFAESILDVMSSLKVLAV